VDPVPLTREEFAVAGVPATAGEPAPPFKNLHIRVRQQIVADGLDRPLDWQSAGKILCTYIQFYYLSDMGLRRSLTHILSLPI